MKKLKLRIKDEKILKNYLDNYIYPKKKQIKSIIITNEQSSINKYSVYLSLKKFKNIKFFLKLFKNLFLL